VIVISDDCATDVVGFDELSDCEERNNDVIMFSGDCTADVVDFNELSDVERV